jgi:hypothetical protein
VFQDGKQVTALFPFLTSSSAVAISTSLNFPEETTIFSIGERSRGSNARMLIPSVDFRLEASVVIMIYLPLFQSEFLLFVMEFQSAVE